MTTYVVTAIVGVFVLWFVINFLAGVATRFAKSTTRDTLLLR